MTQTLPTTSFRMAGADGEGYTPPDEERLCNTPLDRGGTCKRIKSECPYHGPDAPDRTPNTDQDD